MAEIKRYDGSDWESLEELKRWDGTKWEALTTAALGLSGGGFAIKAAVVNLRGSLPPLIRGKRKPGIVKYNPQSTQFGSIQNWVDWFAATRPDPLSNDRMRNARVHNKVLSLRDWPFASAGTIPGSHVFRGRVILVTRLMWDVLTLPGGSSIRGQGGVSGQQDIRGCGTPPVPTTYLDPRNAPWYQCIGSPVLGTQSVKWSNRENRPRIIQTVHNLRNAVTIQIGYRPFSGTPRSDNGKGLLTGWTYLPKETLEAHQVASDISGSTQQFEEIGWRRIITRYLPAEIRGSGVYIRVRAYQRTRKSPPSFTTFVYRGTTWSYSNYLYPMSNTEFAEPETPRGIDPGAAPTPPPRPPVQGGGTPPNITPPSAGDTGDDTGASDPTSVGGGTEEPNERPGGAPTTGTGSPGADGYDPTAPDSTPPTTGADVAGAPDRPKNLKISFRRSGNNVIATPTADGATKFRARARWGGGTWSIPSPTNNGNTFRYSTGTKTYGIPSGATQLEVELYAQSADGIITGPAIFGYRVPAASAVKPTALKAAFQRSGNRIIVTPSATNGVTFRARGQFGNATRYGAWSVPSPANRGGFYQYSTGTRTYTIPTGATRFKFELFARSSGGLSTGPAYFDYDIPAMDATTGPENPDEAPPSDVEVDPTEEAPDVVTPELEDAGEVVDPEVTSIDDLEEEGERPQTTGEGELVARRTTGNQPTYGVQIANQTFEFGIIFANDWQAQELNLGETTAAPTSLKIICGGRESSDPFPNYEDVCMFPNQRNTPANLQTSSVWLILLYEPRA